jgi:hypothetical protein
MQGLAFLSRIILTLSYPISLPPAYSPALIYFGWWITCNYPAVLKERNINMNSPDDFIIYFCLHKIIKVFLISLSVTLLEASYRMKTRLPLACLTVENGFSPSPFLISSAANHAILCCCFFHFAL